MARDLSIHALDLTFKAENAMAEPFVVVELGTNADQVDLPDALTDTPFGVIQDSALAGQSVRVRVSGLTKVVANGAFSKGDQLAIAATTGRVDTVSGLDSSFDNSGGPFTAQKVIGLALEAASEGGQIVEMLIRPFFYPWS